MPSALSFPTTDPTPIFDLSRGNYATDLLVAGALLGLFDRLAQSPCTFDELSAAVGLASRPTQVLFTAVRAMGLVTSDGQRYDLTPLAREHLVANAYFDVSGYFTLMAKSAGVRETMERLKANGPANADTGAAFIFRDGIESAMEQESAARHLTLMLAGRAKNVAPYLAAAVDLSNAKVLLDVAGGSGIYAIAFLQKHPHLRAIVWDRPAVLKVAAEFAVQYGVADRLECLAGDMFADPVPTADVVLLSNVLHDWDVPQCRELVAKFAAALPAGGRMLIHDVFLDDDLGGPLAVALYSAALFCVCEGRAYSAAEYRTWLNEVGLAASEVVPTAVNCGVLTATR